MKTPVDIICPLHGLFKQTPSNHLIAKSGCPACSQSYGEKQVEIFLKSKNINYTKQKKYKDCININMLPFDFYLPDYNICIEFNGIQHYKPVDIFGGEESFKLTKLRDGIKEKYCKNNELSINYKFSKIHIVEFIVKFRNCITKLSDCTFKLLCTRQIKRHVLEKLFQD